MHCFDACIKFVVRFCYCQTGWLGIYGGEKRHIFLAEREGGKCYTSLSLLFCSHPNKYFNCRTIPIYPTCSELPRLTLLTYTLKPEVSGFHPCSCFYVMLWLVILLRCWRWRLYILHVGLHVLLFCDFTCAFNKILNLIQNNKVAILRVKIKKNLLMKVCAVVTKNF